MKDLDPITNCPTWYLAQKLSPALKNCQNCNKSPNLVTLVGCGLVKAFSWAKKLTIGFKQLPKKQYISQSGHAGIMSRYVNAISFHIVGRHMELDWQASSRVFVE